MGTVIVSAEAVSSCGVLVLSHSHCMHLVVLGRSSYRHLFQGTDLFISMWQFLAIRKQAEKSP